MFLTFLSKERAETHIYNINEDQWTSASSLKFARRSHACVEIRNTDGKIAKVLVAGGTVSTMALRSTEIFDVLTGKWFDGPELPSAYEEASVVPGPPTSKHAAILVGGTARIPVTWEYYISILAISNDLTEWKLIGTFKKLREGHVGLIIPPNTMSICPSGNCCFKKVYFDLIRFKE